MGKLRHRLPWQLACGYDAKLALNQAPSRQPLCPATLPQSAYRAERSHLTFDQRQWVSENHVFSSPDPPVLSRVLPDPPPGFAVTLSSQVVCVWGGDALI